jgi:hypothetical protein
LQLAVPTTQRLGKRQSVLDGFQLAKLSQVFSAPISINLQLGICSNPLTHGNDKLGALQEWLLSIMLSTRASTGSKDPVPPSEAISVRMAAWSGQNDVTTASPASSSLQCTSCHSARLLGDNHERAWVLIVASA